jgi:hypothetical protein
VTTYTTAQVRNLTLQHLGVLPSGETPNAADAELAEAAIETVHAQLDGLNLLNWPCCAVPSWAVFPVSFLAANELTDAFGSSAEQMTRIQAKAAAGLIEIRQQTTVSNSGTTPAVYY